MGDFATDSMFGYTENTSAGMDWQGWDPTQASGSDIGQILQDGILGTINKAMNAAVGDKYASGQLTATATPAKATVAAPKIPMMTWLLIGASVYLLAKG